MHPTKCGFAIKGVMTIGSENGSENYRPDLYGHVEASYRTEPPPQSLVDQALAIECPDCNVNVFIEEDSEIDGQYRLVVAHDATCPWLESNE
jgi:hypothetical protein